MTALSATSVSQLTAIVLGNQPKRSASKVETVARFTKQAEIKGISPEGVKAILAEADHDAAVAKLQAALEALKAPAAPTVEAPATAPALTPGLRRLQAATDATRLAAEANDEAARALADAAKRRAALEAGAPKVVPTISAEAADILVTLRACRDGSTDTIDGKVFASTYLDNARPEGMKAHVFAGHLSALEAAGLYRTQGDDAFGLVSLSGEFTTKPTKAPKEQKITVATAAKETAPRAKIETAATIVTVVANPKKAGSRSFQRFALYKAGATVQDFIDACVKAGFPAGEAKADLSWDRRKGFITVKAAA